MRQVWKGIAGARPRSVGGRTWKARLRKRFEGRVEAVAGIFEDGHERVPPESSGPQFAKNHGGADGAVLLWRRGEIAGGIRSTQGKGLVLNPFSRPQAGDALPDVRREDAV